MTEETKKRLREAIENFNYRVDLPVEELVSGEIPNFVSGLLRDKLPEIMNVVPFAFLLMAASSGTPAAVISIHNAGFWLGWSMREKQLEVEQLRELEKRT